ncbi:MAG: hypothetical protein AAF433_19720 [Bacteroidota bacterium]
MNQVINLSTSAGLSVLRYLMLVTFASANQTRVPRGDGRSKRHD